MVSFKLRGKQKFLKQKGESNNNKRKRDESRFITSKNLVLTKGIIGKMKSTYKPVIKRYTI